MYSVEMPLCQAEFAELLRRMKLGEELSFPGLKTRGFLGRVEGEYYFPPLSVRTGRAPLGASGSRYS